MKEFATMLESYMIPAEEGLINKFIGGTHTMYLGTYPDTKPHKDSLSNMQRASTEIVYKDKLNALLAASLTYGNKIDRKSKVVTLTNNSAKSLLDKVITLYEVKCKKVEFYKYSEKSPIDCYTVAGKDILECKEIGEYKVSEIFKQFGAKVENKDVVDGANRKQILSGFISYLRKAVSSDELLKKYVTVYQQSDDYVDFVTGEIDSVSIAFINGPRDADKLMDLTKIIDKYIDLINTQSEKENPIYKKWELTDDWSKNEGFIAIELK